MRFGALRTHNLSFRAKTELKAAQNLRLCDRRAPAPPFQLCYMMEKVKTRLLVHSGCELKYPKMQLHSFTPISANRVGVKLYLGCIS